MRKPDQHIEAEFAAVPPLAVRCSLKDVVPKNEVSTNCLKYFRSFFIRFVLILNSYLNFFVLFQYKQKETQEYGVYFLKLKSLVKRYIALLSLDKKQELIAVCLKKPLRLQIHISGLNLTSLQTCSFA